MIFFSILIFIITPISCFGQIDWTIYNTSNSELPYNQVNDLALDLNNNLIIGTEYGLAKLNNSQEWDIYFDEGDNISLINNVIKYVSVDLDNNVWACGPDGASIMDPNNSWTYLNTSNSELPSNFIRCIFFENENKIWIGSTSGLCLIENDNWSVYDFSAMTGISSNNITIITNHPSNESILIGTLNGGLVSYNNEFIFLNNTNSELLDNTILDFVFDANENLIMTTPFGGLGVWSNTNSWIWFNSETTPSLPFFINSLNNISIDNNGNIWISTMENGLVKYANNNWVFYNTENSQIPDDKINCIQYDEINNQMWIGTETEGLVLMELENINIAENNNNSMLKIKNPCFHTNLLIESQKNLTIKILNYNGSLTQIIELKKGINTIDMSQSKNGIYFIHNPELSHSFFQIIKI